MSFNIIIPCYQAAQSLPRTLDSLLAQKPFLTKIILVNDGSTDETAQVAQQAVENHPDLIVYLAQPNSGPAAARNHGLSQATGEFTLFLDADDELTPDALVSFITSFQQYPEKNILLAGYRSVNEGQSKDRLPLSQSDNRRILHDFLFGKMSLCGGATALRTSLLREARYPENIRHGEDIVFFSQLIAQHPSLTLPFVALIVHHSPGSLRHQSASFLQEGDKLVDTLFKPTVMPPEIMAWKNAYHAQKYLSLSKCAASLHDKIRSRQYIHQAFRVYPLSILNLKMLKQLLKAWLKF